MSSTIFQALKQLFAGAEERARQPVRPPARAGLQTPIDTIRTQFIASCRSAARKLDRYRVNTDERNPEIEKSGMDRSN